MTASADKVQYILQTSLQQTLPLVKKGIFNQHQLRQIMLERQKHQNKLFSSTYKLSHYLKAIEFQYDLQRQRLYKIKNHSQGDNINPLFRKQGKTDFSIVKRTIKLWDRTMHKYRFRSYLWKQYLSFCIAIKSKKQFYKVLTNSLRFLPFDLQLWKIGIRYEVQIGRNLWKARKIFHKALKLVPVGQKNIELTKELILFELEFVEMLQKRQKIIQGQDQEAKNDIKFIIGEQKMNQNSGEQQEQSQHIKNEGSSQILKLRQYHQVLLTALVDSITRICKSNTYFHNKQNLSTEQRVEMIAKNYLKFLNDVKQEEQNELLQHILNQTINRLVNYKYELAGLKIEQNQMEEEEQEKLELQIQEDGQPEQNEQFQEELQIQQDKQVKPVQHNKQVQIRQQIPKQQIYSNQIMETYSQTNKLDEKTFTKVIKQFCLKPLLLSKFLQNLFPHLLSQILDVLKKNQWLRVPLKSLQQILSNLNQNTNQSLKSTNLINYLYKQISKINPVQFMGYPNLLNQIIQFNKRNGKIEENNKLYRSILVNCKQNVQFVQRVKGLFVA